MYRIKNTSILKEIQMSKSCAFFGNDYKWSRSDIIAQIKGQALLLIDGELVDTFYVGVKRTYKQDNQSIRTVFVIEVNDGKRYFDSSIYPDQDVMGYKCRCIVHQDNWVIENTVPIIAYNQMKGRAFEVYRKTKNKDVMVIE